MRTFLVGSLGTITDADKVTEKLIEQTGLEKIDLKRISNNSKDTKNFKYYAPSIIETAERQENGYILVYSGYDTETTKEKIYLVLRNSKYGLVSNFINTEAIFRKVFLRNLENSRERKAPEIRQVESRIEEIKDAKDFYSQLADMLLIRDSWTEKALRTYITAIISRATKLGNKGKTDNIIINENKSRAIVNCGLLDKYCREILIDYSRIQTTNEAPKIVYSKQELIQKGFSKQDLDKRLNPIVFWEDNEDLMFEGELSDFDLLDISSITHILTDRIERFPESVRELPLDMLYNKLVKSIEIAVKISVRDKHYIVPTYEIKYDRLQFLVPFHVSVSAGDKPELAIIISKEGAFWSPMTVISREEAYYNAKCVSPYIDSWLSSSNTRGYQSEH